MKILFLTPNFEGYIGIGKYYYLEELKRQAEVVAYGKYYPDYKPSTSVKDLMPDAEAICYWQCATTPAGTFKDLRESRLPKIALMQNGHNYQNAQIKLLNDNAFDLALFPSWAEYTFFYKEHLNCPMQLYPQSIEPSVFKDWGLPKTVDFMTAGLVGPFYPMRHAISRKLRELDGEFKTLNLGHWGYKYDTHLRYEKELKPKGFLWREDYAQAINKSRIFMFDGGRYYVAVAKYYEGMACKSLVLAPRPFMAEAYHFEDGTNFVHVDCSNMESKMQYYLKNEDERDTIVENAYATVMKYHTNAVRVKELLTLLENQSWLS